MRFRNLSILLALLLFVSVLGNVMLAQRPHATAAILGTPHQDSMADLPLIELRSQLSECRRASIDLLGAAFRGDGTATASTRSMPDAGRAHPASAAQQDLVTPGVERDTLCGIALQHLRRSWEEARAPLSDILRREATDPQSKTASLDRDMNELAATLNLDPSERERFVDRYGPIRTERLAAVAAEMALAEPDFNRVSREIHGLFVDEDSLVRSFYGNGAVDLYRATQLDKRTAVLAILATLSNQPWDDHISW